MLQLVTTIKNGFVTLRSQSAQLPRLS